MPGTTAHPDTKAAPPPRAATTPAYIWIPKYADPFMADKMVNSYPSTVVTLCTGIFGGAWSPGDPNYWETFDICAVNAELGFPDPTGIATQGVRFKCFGVQEVPVERVSASCCGTTGGNRTKGSEGRAHDRARYGVRVLRATRITAFRDIQQAYRCEDCHEKEERKGWLALLGCGGGCLVVIALLVLAGCGSASALIVVSKLS